MNEREDQDERLDALLQDGRTHGDTGAAFEPTSTRPDAADDARQLDELAAALRGLPKAPAPSPGFRAMLAECLADCPLPEGLAAPTAVLDPNASLSPAGSLEPNAELAPTSPLSLASSLAPQQSSASISTQITANQQTLVSALDVTTHTATPVEPYTADLELALDDALARLLAGESDVETLLGLLPGNTTSEGVRPLLALATALQGLPDAPAPDPVFRRRLALQIATAPLPNSLADRAAQPTADLVQILDRGIALVRSGYADVETALAQVPDAAAELEPLVALAAALDALPSLPGPAPEFRQRLAGQLLAAPAPRTLRQRRWSDAWFAAVRRMWRSTAFMAAATAAIVLFIGSGVTFASANALPQQPLYPVKRAVEAVRLWFAGDLASMDLHLDFAKRRLTEALAAPDDAGAMLADFSREVTAALVSADHALDRGVPRPSVAEPLLDWLIGARLDLVSARTALPPLAWRVALAQVDAAILALRSGQPLAWAPIPRLVDPAVLMAHAAWGSLPSQTSTIDRVAWAVTDFPLGGAGRPRTDVGDPFGSDSEARLGSRRIEDGAGQPGRIASRPLPERAAAPSAARGSGPLAPVSRQTGREAGPGEGGQPGAVPPPTTRPAPGEPTDPAPPEPQPTVREPRPVRTARPTEPVEPTPSAPVVPSAEPPTESPRPTETAAPTDVPLPTAAPATPEPSPTIPVVNEVPQVGVPTCSPAIIPHLAKSVCTVQATDPDGDPLTYEWSSAAGRWEYSDQPTATFVAEIPNIDQYRKVDVKIVVKVSDGHGNSATAETSVRVMPLQSGLAP